MALMCRIVIGFLAWVGLGLLVALAFATIADRNDRRE